MNASTASAARSGTGRPPTRTGAMALGCTRSFSSRPAWRASTSVRNILMPPPVEPVLQTMPDRNSIQMGANTGHVREVRAADRSQPVVVASETTLNAA